MKRAELDGNNSSEKPDSVEEMIADKMNDQWFEPVSERLKDLHPLLTNCKQNLANVCQWRSLRWLLLVELPISK